MKLRTYTRLVILDLWRLRQLVLPQILVVAGICLPILLLQGLKRGHVQELSRELRSSPTGRTITFWPSQKLRHLTRPDQKRLADELAHVELIIPEMSHQGTLSSTKGGQRKQVSDVTLYTTSPGDPVLALIECDVLADGERGIILGHAVAKELGVAVGDDVTLTVKRSSTGQEGSVALKVKAVKPARQGEEKVADLDSRLQDQIEHFVLGDPVVELGWPGGKQDATDEYEAYLLFCEPGDDLKEKDLQFLKEKDFIVDRLKEDDPRRTLHGLFKAHNLTVYALHRGGKPITDDFRDILKKTSPSDDLIVPWNKPRDHTLAGTTYRLVGLSLDDKNIWLSKYLVQPQGAFEFGADKLSILFPHSTAPGGSAAVEVKTPAGLITVPLKVTPLGGAPAVSEAKPPLAVLPVDMLAYLHAAEAGRVVYDPAAKKFNPRPSELNYIRARLYCDTIDAVPATTEELYKRGYLFKAEEDRILEIQRQDASLAFIVLMVSIGVLAFGVFTIANVLVDSTARKRATIGILRVMGVSQLGVFYIVVFRAAMIGMFAGLLTLGGGIGLGLLLRQLPDLAQTVPQLSSIPKVLILFERPDLAIVFGSAIACCILGSLYPAWTASRVDPYETIIEGKFR